MAEAFIPGTRSARQALIAQILVREKISSQGGLQKRLREEGISVTQATLSRDLDEMSAVKVKDASGRQYYRVPEPEEVQAATQGARVQLSRWAAEVLISVQQAGNQLVLRTPPGAAQLLASGIDRALLDDVMGCIAGDDTVLVITTGDEAATSLREQLLDLK